MDNKKTDDLFSKAIEVISFDLLNSFSKKKLDTYLLENENFINSSYNKLIKNRNKAAKAKQTRKKNVMKKQMEEMNNNYVDIQKKVKIYNDLKDSKLKSPKKVKDNSIYTGL